MLVLLLIQKGTALGNLLGRRGRGGSLVVGIVMSKLVEYPILRLRDRVLPASDIIPVADKVGIAVQAENPTYQGIPLFSGQKR